MIRYLLGELSELERERLEETFFADDEAFEQILIAEEELIDSYVGGELSRDERGRFERLFLASPQGRQRVQFARVLSGAVSEAHLTEKEPVTTPTPKPAFFAALRPRSFTLRLAFTTVALLTVVGLSWLLIERLKMSDELRQLRDDHVALRRTAQEFEQQATTEQNRIKELVAQLEAERARPSPEVGGQNGGVIRQGKPSAEGNVKATRPSTVLFALTPGLVRGGGGALLRVPHKASFINLQLSVEAGTYISYRAVIETAGGSQVWRVDSVKPRHVSPAGGTIVLRALPAKVLPPGNYIVFLSGRRQDGTFEDVADYSFKVMKK